MEGYILQWIDEDEDEDEDINIKNGRIYIRFVDFHKAIDNVWQDALLLKLHNIGIQGKWFFLAIQDIYRYSYVCTKTTDRFSRELPVLKGIHQGNTLSPQIQYLHK